MIITTTHTIQGKTITDYRGIVFGEVIVGANIFKDVKASLTNFFGGRSGAYEESLMEARGAALKEMGASAIVGMLVNYQVIGVSGNNMLMVTTCGTAVRTD